MSLLPQGMLVLAALSSASCTAGNSYTGTRVIPPQTASLTLAGAGVWSQAQGGTGQREPTGYKELQLRRERFDLTAVPVPTQLRIGLAKGVDGGIRVGRTSHTDPPSVQFGVDFRTELRRGDLDLALDPSVLYTNEFHLRPEVPLLLGINPSRHLQIILSPGLGYLIALDRSRFDPGPIARAGLGIRAALAESFALFPEVTASHLFAERSFTTVTAGLGVELRGLGRGP